MNKSIRSRQGFPSLPRPLKWWVPNVTGRIPEGRFFDMYAYLEGSVESRRHLLFNLVHDQVYRVHDQTHRAEDTSTRCPMYNGTITDGRYSRQYLMSGRLFRTLTSNNSSEEWEAIVYGYMKYVQDCRTVLRRHRSEWSKRLSRITSELMVNDGKEVGDEKEAGDDKVNHALYCICRLYHEDHTFRRVIKTQYVLFLMKHVNELNVNEQHGNEKNGIRMNGINEGADQSMPLLLDSFVYPWLVYALLLESQGTCEGIAAKGTGEGLMPVLGRLRVSTTASKSEVRAGCCVVPRHHPYMCFCSRSQALVPEPCSKVPRK
ncbi:hypothetical protein GNI_082280 [Gregarina niphandrodes]|uniref:Uncharacterized protein n=1 Tax=Gregarina niphandrodes TaxID=110365 RepID=A0A023B655_GRENI|nr:hypothetical protein GNI_082280 [Gregarina niphandrodes]EZG65677.1 hypothetical protein GNI_082280 [Gregarina niphandrodes]|eukprot:XP_011134058.1 hypothetical protein GNI_082280 [Gregarina niphandrodes]